MDLVVSMVTIILVVSVTVLAETFCIFHSFLIHQCKTPCYCCKVYKIKLWFPFELRLKWTLKVDIHCFLSCVTCHLARSDKYNGWCFKIKGQYHLDKVKTALEDAKLAKSTDRIPGCVQLQNYK